MAEVLDRPPSINDPIPQERPAEHWKTRQARERREAEAKAAEDAKAKAGDGPKDGDDGVPAGGWPGDTPPSEPVVEIKPPPNANPVPAPAGVLSFFDFALRYFTSNQIREESYKHPKPLRSMASDCLNAYHAYVYTIALGCGISTKLPDAAKYGGVLAIHDDIAGAVAAMDREMVTTI